MQHTNTVSKSSWPERRGEEAGKKGVQILGLQEVFNGPYFCPSQDKRWYDAAEPVPGPTVEKLIPIEKKRWGLHWLGLWAQVAARRWWASAGASSGR